MKLNSSYTFNDHKFRENDEWALFKYRLTVKEIERKFAKWSGLKIYDVGCGAGYFSRLLAINGCKVTAIEPDREAFELATSEKSVSNIEWINANISEVSRNVDGDIVIMHDVLEHIDAEGRAVKEIAELLKPGGLLVLSVPASELLFGFHDVQLGHFRRYSKSSLRRALRNDFEIEQIRYIGAIGIPIIIVFSKILKKPYPSKANSKSSFLQTLFGWILRLEGLLPLPFGSGLIVVGVKKTSKDEYGSKPFIL